MSISDEVLAREKEGRIVRLTPPFDTEHRRLYLSDEVRGWVMEPWSHPPGATRGMALRADLESFVRGDTIAAATALRKRDDTYLALLDPPEKGIWQIRSLAPRPSIRILGAFVARDCFIALAAEERKWLEGFRSRPWRRAIASATSSWRRLFPAYNPLGLSNRSPLHNVLTNYYDTG